MSDYMDYSLTADPLVSFENWFNEACKIEENAPAMTFSTINHNKNRPNSRTVLLKQITPKGLIFFTNYESNKALDLVKNNEACINFYWHKSKKQVRIQGTVAKTTKEVSEKYFKSRDLESQLASYMSNQSRPVEDKKALLHKLEEVKKEFQSKEIPLPSQWGGYLFTPYEFEFFLYGDYRLNDRFLYEQVDGQWKVTRLQP